MDRLQSARRPYALVSALIGWAALALQLYVTIGTAAANGKSAASAVVIFASYFTILTNILAAVCMTWSFSARPAFSPSPALVSAVTLYMVVVGIVYTLLLRDLWAPEGLQWLADVILHNLAPVLFALYWLLFVSKGRLGWSAPVPWLVYPLAYLAVSLLRGASVGFYPYPFIDVPALGYGRVALNAFGLVLAFLALGLLLVALDHRLGRSFRRAQA